MDSHLIYTVSDSKKNKIVWDKVTPESEWIYIFNANNEISEKLVIDNINCHFINDLLFIVSTRQLSKQISKKGINKEIIQLLVDQNILIWDADFVKAMEFNKIGTMRCGKLKSDN